MVSFKPMESTQDPIAETEPERVKISALLRDAEIGRLTTLLINSLTEEQLSVVCEVFERAALPEVLLPEQLSVVCEVFERAARAERAAPAHAPSPGLGSPFSRKR
jgi:hypothetical protein